jgi:hypothetical protein
MDSSQPAAFVGVVRRRFVHLGGLPARFTGGKGCEACVRWRERKAPSTATPCFTRAWWHSSSQEKLDGVHFAVLPHKCVCSTQKWWASTKNQEKAPV